MNATGMTWWSRQCFDRVCSSTVLRAMLNALCVRTKAVRLTQTPSSPECGNCREFWLFEIKQRCHVSAGLSYNTQDAPVGHAGLGWAFSPLPNQLPLLLPF